MRISTFFFLSAFAAGCMAQGAGAEPKIEILKPEGNQVLSGHAYRSPEQAESMKKAPEAPGSTEAETARDAEEKTPAAADSGSAEKTEHREKQ